MALFTTEPRLRFYAYFVALDDYDWSLFEATYTDPTTGAVARVAAGAVWMRDDRVDAQPPAGAVAAIIQKRVAGPTGSHPVVIPAVIATPQAPKAQPKANPKAPHKKRAPAKKASPKKRATSKKKVPRKASKKAGKRKTAKASRKK